MFGEGAMINIFIGRFGRSITHWRQARDGMRRLEHLDDRMLADIGITRSQIYSAAMRGRERH
jgi:uncharacterized protein YjiS (DUF1127 family)